MPVKLKDRTNCPDIDEWYEPYIASESNALMIRAYGKVQAIDDNVLKTLTAGVDGLTTDRIAELDFRDTTKGEPGLPVVIKDRRTGALSQFSWYQIERIEIARPTSHRASTHNPVNPPHSLSAPAVRPPARASNEEPGRKRQTAAKTATTFREGTMLMDDLENATGTTKHHDTLEIRNRKGQTIGVVYSPETPMEGEQRPPAHLIAIGHDQPERVRRLARQLEDIALSLRRGEADQTGLKRIALGLRMLDLDDDAIQRIAQLTDELES